MTWVQAYIMGGMVILALMLAAFPSAGFKFHGWIHALLACTAIVLIWPFWLVSVFRKSRRS